MTQSADEIIAQANPVYRIKPTGTFMLVEPDNDDEEQVGSIWLPTMRREGSAVWHGVVVKVGPDVEKFSVGDSVFFAIAAGLLIPVGAKSYTFLREDQIIAHEIEGV